MNWRYEIQYGPNGEDDYAWVYDDNGQMVCTTKTNNAIKVVHAMNVYSDGLLNGVDRLSAEHYQRVARNLANVWTNGNDGARTCFLAALLRAAGTPAVTE